MVFFIEPESVTVSAVGPQSIPGPALRSGVLGRLAIIISGQHRRSAITL
jgi:hypothetical protein